MSRAHTTHKKKDNFRKGQLLLVSDTLFQNNSLFYHPLPFYGKILKPPPFGENFETQKKYYLQKNTRAISVFHNLSIIFYLCVISVFHNLSIIFYLYVLQVTIVNLSDQSFIIKVWYTTVYVTWKIYLFF